MANVTLILFSLFISSFGPDAASRLAALKDTVAPSVDVAPTATWSDDTPAAAAPQDTLYLVTESWCGPCQSLKRNLKSEGIPYTTLSLAEMKTRFNRTVKSIPYMFYVRSDDQRVGSYGSMGVDDLRKFVAPLQLHAVASKRQERKVCRVRGKRSPQTTVAALVTHLIMTSGERHGPIAGGLMPDIHIPLTAKLSDIMVLVSHKQSVKLGKFVTASWKDLSITSSEGRTRFLSPVVISGEALGISLSAELKELYLHEDGRTLDVIIEGLPDLRVVFD